MYTSTVFNRHVRDAAAPYGGGWMERESFPAEGVLRDLRRRENEGDALRILARFCAIRFVLLRDVGAPAALVDHARTATADHLAAVTGPWPEGVRLRRLIERPSSLERAAAVLAGAASDAEAVGHVHGAYAARCAAYRIARRRLPYRPASELARGMAAFLERHGEGARARVWTRRAERLSRLDGSPPSAS